MKRYFLSILLAAVCCISTQSVKADTDIYAWVNGATTCFKLESEPTVCYKTVNNVRYAYVTLKGKTEPCITLPLNDDQCLEIGFGTYVNTSVTLNAKGYATYSFNKDVQVLSGCNAYTVHFEGNVIKCTKITDGKIPAYNGVLLFGKPNAEVTIGVLSDAPAALSNNQLLPTTTSNGLADKVASYTLSGDTFKTFAGTSYNANKAYLPTSAYTGDNVKSFEIAFDDNDEETGITTTPATLSPVHQMGKFIYGGKLIIIRDGKQYDASGRMIK